MKKVRLLLASVLLISLIALAACGSDNDNNNNNDTDNTNTEEPGNNNENGNDNNNDNNNADNNGDNDGNNEGETSKLDELREACVVDVVVAVDKPYGYENEDGELTGASVDTAIAVFNELGIYEVEGHLADYRQLVPGLGAGKFDAITSGMAITPERCEEIGREHV